MKQKFTFETDAKKDRLTLTESAETDPGVFLILHSEEYDFEALKAAVSRGLDPFLSLLRRKNLFPPSSVAGKLFTSFSDFIVQESEDKLVVDYDDTEALPEMDGIMMIMADEDEDDEEVELDQLLTSSDEDLSEDDIKEIDSDDDTPRFRIDDDSEQEN